MNIVMRFKRGQMQFNVDGGTKTKPPAKAFKKCLAFASRHGFVLNAQTRNVEEKRWLLIFEPYEAHLFRKYMSTLGGKEVVI